VSQQLKPMSLMYTQKLRHVEDHLYLRVPFTNKIISRNLANYRFKDNEIMESFRTLNLNVNIMMQNIEFRVLHIKITIASPIDERR
jgi:hypothetical protein